MKSLRPRASLTRAAVPALLASMAAPGLAAAAPYEPNDTFLQAVGPLVGGQSYEASIENDGDRDYYYFNVSGQRQLDVALAMVSELPDGDTDSITASLYDPDGNYVSGGYTDADRPGETGHMKFTSPSSTQYVLSVSGDDVGTYQGSTYRIRVDPPDALVQTDPGMVAKLNPLDSKDDAQRLYVDGQLVGESRGLAGGTYSLGVLPPTSRLTFEATNEADSLSWNVELSNTAGRTRSVLFSEKHYAASPDLQIEKTPKGVVRRVTLTPTGGVLETCGVALAPIGCDAPTPGAPQAPGTGIERIKQSVEISRRSGRYRGRVYSSMRGCYGGVTVRLRRKGKGTKSYGSTVTRPDGSWTIRGRPVVGKVYAYVEPKSISETQVCWGATSRALRRT